jgi:hypothetical protein
VARGSQRRFRRLVVRVLKRYTIHFSVAYVLIALAAVPLSLWVFPSTTLMLTVIVVVGNVLAAIASLGSLVVGIEDADL